MFPFKHYLNVPYNRRRCTARFIKTICCQGPQYSVDSVSMNIYPNAKIWNYSVSFSLKEKITLAKTKFIYGILIILDSSIST